MIATVTDVSANLATSREQDSVRLSVPATKPMSTENVNATTAFLCLTANALLHSSAHLTVNLTVLQATVSARQDFQLLEDNVQAINIVAWMATLNTVNATATLDTSGSTESADLAEPIKVSMVSHANAILASLLMQLETVCNLTSNLPATKTKDTMQI